MDDLRLPKLIAHRGAPLSAPENTLSALYKAKELGATWVEFDVQLTKDNIAIIIHDETLDRTTNGKGLIAALDFSEITDLDAGSWFSHEFKAEPVPTLSQYLQCAAELNLGINVELKGTESQALLLAQCVVQELKRCWSDQLPAPLISGDEKCLLALKQYHSPYFQGYVMDGWTDHWNKIMKSLNCASIHVNYRELNPERVKAIKSSRKILLAYTIDDASVARKLLDMGVDTIFSDDPQLLTSKHF